ncbi:ABC transporter substrate-binding protein [Pacificitalea manganoxidans]|uniref:ABC transporter substrate-binding protein n=1 Tax=Pacificitalea manganoxidans TaxID=1411902 RepID=A0A291LZ44_9RHOB|nr:ABC transporter substrate-binding protein [Pacificitalea manganoxidans]ATI41715.1 ABC transporter substrate-binding protein [Pacificitalea manganoxidans]MAQ47241.1 ABC transporter substrate-binding protein [Actibacterium sp.]MDR6309171.1 TRAP-type mannitol/chloroaromatic compound transport system substrate-binding protein [Pacificitalea manganoxidans]OWU67586.1 ABC transporter substrate-binding protein [Roseovarius sp. 22II1-1F6A]|tara:strand:+ start:1040 stop:2128 length:1089 start_codon:yes stop_codon:yes gene_type:complete
MDRRSFLRTSALGGSAAAAATLAAPAYAQGKRTLTMVTTWPRGLAGVWDSVERFANNMTAATDGQITVEPKAAGELVGALEVFDAVTSGQADIYHGADYYFIGQHPSFAYFTAVPFGMTAPEIMTWYYGQDGMALHHELGEIFGIKSFIAGQTGAQGGGWFRNPINSADDIQGLKFRMPGLGGQVMAKLGASVQVLPGGEIYQALSTGALDATEWIGPWSDEKLGLQEIAKNYYPAGFHEPGAALSVACNLEVFNTLTPSQQKAFELSAADAHQHNYALFIANNGPALERLKSSGVQIQTFSDDIWEAFGRASQEVLAENMDDEIYAKIHNSAMNSMRSTSGWLSVSDSAYTTQRNRVLDAL